MDKKEQKEEVNEEKNNIVNVVSKYVKLKKIGNIFKGLCPFHYEHTPSFVVSPKKNIFACFGCGISGDAIKFIDLIKNPKYSTINKLIEYHNNKEFELEFCLKRDSYCKAYNEDGTLWDEFHEKNMILFHELFKSEKGQQQIISDLMYAVRTFFKRRDTYLKAFDKNEFSIEEYDLIKFIIKNMR